jgi:Uma2 family endonuclease
MTTATTYSKEEEMPLSEAADFEVQYQTERGKPMPSYNHAFLQLEIGFQLKVKYNSEFDILSELSLDLSSGKAVPDLCIYTKKPQNWQRDIIRLKDAPLLAIEILSPKQAFDDIVDKIQDIYFPAGVLSAWIVVPSAESVILYKPNEKPESFTKTMVKDSASGFELDLNLVFN